MKTTVCKRLIRLWPLNLTFNRKVNSDDWNMMRKEAHAGRLSSLSNRWCRSSSRPLTHFLSWFFTQRQNSCCRGTNVPGERNALPQPAASQPKLKVLEQVREYFSHNVAQRQSCWAEPPPELKAAGRPPVTRFGSRLGLSGNPSMLTWAVQFS